MSERGVQSAGGIWHAALTELQSQMTKATFDTWVKPTFAISLNEKVLVVGVRNTYAEQWLSNRLYSMIQRAVSHVVGQTVEIQFVLKAHGEYSPDTVSDEFNDPASVPSPRSGDIIVDLIDPPLEPSIQLQKYAIWFWQPLVGELAFSTWVMLRTLDKQNRGRGPKNRISVDLVAQTLGCHRQSIVGRQPLSELQGAFGRLNQERMAKIDAVGKGHDVIYWARVLNALPFLSPQQVETLPQLLQARHEVFLKDFHFDAEKWEQLEIESLIRD